MKNQKNEKEKLLKRMFETRIVIEKLSLRETVVTTLTSRGNNGPAGVAAVVVILPPGHLYGIPKPLCLMCKLQ